MKLILLLQQGNKQWTANKLADHFQVSKRTVFRDMRALSELNVPVTMEEGGGYGIMPDYKIPPLMFTERELGTILIGLQFVLSQVDQALVEEARGVSLKVKQVLPDRLKSWMESLEEKTVVDPYLRFGGVKRRGGDWFRVGVAISNHQTIEFDYPSKRKSGEVERRKVDPYLLVYFEDHWNMIGLSHERGEVRNFILHKAENLVLSDENFDSLREMDVEALIFRFNGLEEKVVCEVRESHLRRFELHLPTKIIKKTPISAEVFKVEFLFDNLSYINEWLLQFGTGVRVCEPDELIEKRRVLLNEMVKNE